jgi:hypothetical protein
MGMSHYYTMTQPDKSLMHKPSLLLHIQLDWKMRFAFVHVLISRAGSLPIRTKAKLTLEFHCTAQQ